MRVAVIRVIDSGVLQNAIGQIKRSNTALTISLFASKPKIEAWTQEGKLSMLPCEGALLIHRHDGNLLRIYHVARDLLSLSASLCKLVSLMADQILVADLVGKPEEVGPVTRIYQRAGFVTHVQLVRMHRTGLHPTSKEGFTDVELATDDDVSKLRAFMEHWLDPLSEQIQSTADLREAIVSEAVLVVRIGDAIAGMLIHETTGQSTLLRYWHVARNHHCEGIGSRLMRAFLSRCATSRRTVLWVVAGNTDAISKYSHYGFSKDGMIDNIMVSQPKEVTR